MATIEEIKDAINTYLENNTIDGYCRVTGPNDLVVWLNGNLNRDVVELPITNYTEVTTYTIDMSTNKITYNYVP